MPSKQTTKTMSHFIKQKNEPSDSFFPGGLFLHANTLPTSFIALIPSPSSSSSNSDTVSWGIRKRFGCDILRVEACGVFSSLSLSINGSDSDHTYTRESNEVKVEEKENIRVDGSGAINMTKHLWAGAFSAMVSRFSLLNLYSITHLLTHILILVFSFHYLMYIAYLQSFH